MKIQILDQTGKKAKEMQTKLFDEPVRIDIISKVLEAEKIRQPYAPKKHAGMDRSASGKIRHLRHAWKSDRGRGLSRVPRKVFWRRGVQFSWEAAVIPFARGGRRAHPPKGGIKPRKINKKEYKKAFLSSLSYVNSLEELKKKYSSLNDKKLDTKLPIVISYKVLNLETKKFLETLKKITGDFYNIALQRKTVRPGRGKRRGRKNKKNAGILMIIGNEEEKKIKGVKVIKANKVKITDLASNGARLTVFTENAIKDLENMRANKK